MEADEGFIADTNLLTRGASILVVSYQAHLYWKKETLPGSSPFWENLLKPPVRVRARVG